MPQNTTPAERPTLAHLVERATTCVRNATTNAPTRMAVDELARRARTIDADRRKLAGELLDAERRATLAERERDELRATLDGLAARTAPALPTPHPAGRIDEDRRDDLREILATAEVLADGEAVDAYALLLAGVRLYLDGGSAA